MIAPEREEVWRPVVGFAGRYEVSSEGRVRYAVGSKTGRAAGDLVPIQTGKRCVFVSLWDSTAGKCRSVSVSKLVAETFLCPAPYSGAVVAHADGDPANCAVWNIRWTKNTRGGKHPAREVSPEYEVAIEMRVLVKARVRAGDADEAWERLRGKACLRPLKGFNAEVLPLRKPKMTVEEVKHVAP